MTEVVVYRLVASHRAAAPFDGEGARLHGGRWNGKGRRAVYAADSEALALLEVLVHLEDPYLLERYRLFRLKLPSDDVQRLDFASLPENWREDPPSIDTARLGDRWLVEAGKLALAVPSSVAVRDWNYLVNPEHAAFAAVAGAAEELDLELDTRLRGR